MKKTIVVMTLLIGSLGMAKAEDRDSVANRAGSWEHIEKNEIRYKKAKVDGLEIFYREAGDKSKPAILLLHGFPSSSHMYRDLIADLADSYYLVAPDYPGFGQSSSPSPSEYNYTFDNLATTMSHFIDVIGLKKFSLYVQDYGGPVGFRIASQRPELIQALIVQNANAYKEGLGDAIKPMVDYFQNPNPETEKGARWILSTESTVWQYTEGVEDKSRINPDSYIVDQAYLDRPGNDLIQLSFFRDYKSNLACMMYGRLISGSISQLLW
jgi:pimeloyl-ACP methyl ester carboxylesterase